MGSRIVFQSTGLDSLIHDIDRYIPELNKEIAFAGADNLKEVQKHARKNHRFTSRNGNAGLEGAVQVEQKQNGNVHKFKIFLNDLLAGHGKYIHEGTYQGYDQSPIAPPYSSSTSKSGKGWKADPFLWRAIKQKWKMTKSLKEITAKLKKKYTRA